MMPNTTFKITSWGQTFELPMKEINATIVGEAKMLGHIVWWVSVLLKRRVRIDMKPLFHLVYIIMIAKEWHMPKCVLIEVSPQFVFHWVRALPLFWWVMVPCKDDPNVFGYLGTTVLTHNKSCTFLVRSQFLNQSTLEVLNWYFGHGWTPDVID